MECGVDALKCREFFVEDRGVIWILQEYHVILFINERYRKFYKISI